MRNTTERYRDREGLRSGSQDRAVTIEVPR